MEYLKFYGLNQEPFRNEADARFYYESRAQVNARLRLLRGIEQHKGLCVLLGPAGCGKTTLAQYLLAALDRQRFLPRLLIPAHASVDSAWLLRRIAVGYGVQRLRSEPVQILAQIYEQLGAAHEAERQPVLLFDEAQMLRERDLLEQFRALLNLERNSRKLLSLVLFGMNELDNVLKLEPALAQRVEIRVRLAGLERDEVANYLAHRLRCVEAPAGIFASEAVDAIHEYSGGIPRLVNTLADNALFEGFVSRANPIDPSVVLAVAEELGLCEAHEPTPDEEELSTVSPFDPATDLSAPQPSLPGLEPTSHPDGALGLVGPSDFEGAGSAAPRSVAARPPLTPLAEGLQDLAGPATEAEPSAVAQPRTPPEPVEEAGSSEHIVPQPDELPKLTLEPEAREHSSAEHQGPEEDIDILFKDIQLGDD
jgi:type II secretory pathway predicted ATPase ExeA